MAKGDYPAHLNGDGTEKEAYTRRHWGAIVKGIWDGLPSALRTAILVAAAGWGSVTAKDYFTDKKVGPDVLMSEDDFANVVRKEIAPMKAGFKAFVATQPEKVQLAVLKAWNREEEKLKEAK